VNNCSATICGETAISGYQISDCRGTSTSGSGILSYGTVANSYGYSKGGGIYSNGTVANSYGYTTGTSISSHGIYATEAVQNSYGYSRGGNGIYSYGTVANSCGDSNSAAGDGIRARIVSYSYGRSYGTASSADGIQAFIATSCVVSGGEHITHKYLMP